MHTSLFVQSAISFACVARQGPYNNSVIITSTVGCCVAIVYSHCRHTVSTGITKNAHSMCVCYVTAKR